MVHTGVNMKKLLSKLFQTKFNSDQDPDLSTTIGDLVKQINRIERKQYRMIAFLQAIGYQGKLDENYAPTNGDSEAVDQGPAPNYNEPQPELAIASEYPGMATGYTLGGMKT